MTSKLKAIGISSRQGHYAIRFYYQTTFGGRDILLPEWEIPANSWDHMHNTVRSFNEVE